MEEGRRWQGGVAQHPWAALNHGEAQLRPRRPVAVRPQQQAAVAKTAPVAGAVGDGVACEAA